MLMEEWLTRLLDKYKISLVEKASINSIEVKEAFF